jgi:hypothetical protein
VVGGVEGPQHQTGGLQYFGSDLFEATVDGGTGGETMVGGIKDGRGTSNTISGGGTSGGGTAPGKGVGFITETRLPQRERTRFLPSVSRISPSAILTV